MLFHGRQAVSSSLRLGDFIDMVPMLTKERKCEHWKTRKKGVFTVWTCSCIRVVEVTVLSSQWRKCTTLGVKNVTLQITAGRKLSLGLHFLGNVILGHSAMTDSSSSWVTRGKARFSLLLLPGGLGRDHAKAGSSD